tara:strand:+ start:1166 stop:1324 length:159 start_codon:yes stop_codon:yes gene_type:complete
MTKYQLTPATDGSIIKKDDAGNFLASIPPDADNSDYQEYLEWAKTNTAEVAD